MKAASTVRKLFLVKKTNTWIISMQVSPMYSLNLRYQDWRVKKVDTIYLQYNLL